MKRLVSPTKSVQEKVRQLVHNVYGYASLYTYDRQNADSYDLSIEGSIQSLSSLVNKTTTGKTNTLESGITHL